MLRIRLRRKHLIKTVQRLVDQTLLRQYRLNPRLQRRTLLHHAAGHIKHNGSLLPVGSAPVHLPAVFHIPAGKQKRHRSRQLRLPLLLRNLHISRIKLPVSVGLHDPKQIPYDLLLPVNQLKILPVPFPLGMFQAPDKRHRQIGQLPIVGRTLPHEPGRLIFLQFPQRHQPPSCRKKQEKRNLPHKEKPLPKSLFKT